MFVLATIFGVSPVMRQALIVAVGALLSIPGLSLASSPIFDARTNDTSVVVKNLADTNHMEMRLNVGDCGATVMMGPGGVVWCGVVR